MAVLLAAAALAPAASADLNTRTFLIAAEWTDTGPDGLGVYEANPTDATNLCLVFFFQWAWVTASLTYYDYLRLWPQAGVGVSQMPLPDQSLQNVPLLQDCFDQVFDLVAPGGQNCPPDCQSVANDGLNAAVGLAASMQNILGANEVAVLANPIDVAASYYDTVVSADFTPGDLLGGALAPTLTVGASDIDPPNEPGFDVFSACTGASTLTYNAAVVGSIIVNEPFFLAGGIPGIATPSGPCNSQRGAQWFSFGLGSFISEYCMAVDAFDIVTGVTSRYEDTDWAYMLGPNVAVGDLLTWLNVPDVVTTGQLTNLPDLNGAGLVGEGIHCLGACEDGRDNDGDGFTDFGVDAGCTGPAGDTELTDCQDGGDNDGGGAVDLADPGCANVQDTSEVSQCQDGVDNDAGGAVDGADAGCANAEDNNELSLCDDNFDNDGDTFVDFDGADGIDGNADDDPECVNAEDNNEVV